MNSIKFISHFECGLCNSRRRKQNQPEPVNYEASLIKYVLMFTFYALCVILFFE